MKKEEVLNRPRKTSGLWTAISTKLNNKERRALRNEAEKARLAK